MDKYQVMNNRHGYFLTLVLRIRALLLRDITGYPLRIQNGLGSQLATVSHAHCVPDSGFCRIHGQISLIHNTPGHEIQRKALKINKLQETASQLEC